MPSKKRVTPRRVAKSKATVRRSVPKNSRKRPPKRKSKTSTSSGSRTKVAKRAVKRKRRVAPRTQMVATESATISAASLAEPTLRTRTREATGRTFGFGIRVDDARGFGQMVPNYGSLKASHALELNREFTGEIDPTFGTDDLTPAMTIDGLTSDIRQRLV